MIENLRDLLQSEVRGDLALAGAHEITLSHQRMSKIPNIGVFVHFLLTFSRTVLLKFSYMSEIDSKYIIRPSFVNVI